MTVTDRADLRVTHEPNTVIVHASGHSGASSVTRMAVVDALVLADALVVNAGLAAQEPS